jgi:DNA-binding winged helix-turn-helix (wHTH) protein/HAMP domain-containing protein
MTAREFELLRVLVLHPRQVFSRHLFELVWGSNGDRSAVSVYVSWVRDKIEHDPADPRYIVTVWGAGYRFDGDSRQEATEWAACCPLQRRSHSRRTRAPAVRCPASAAGYLIETHRQQADGDHRLAAAAAYISNGAAQANTTQWQQALTGKLAALHLSAELTIASPTSKRSIYQPRPSASESKPKTSFPDPGSPDLGQPTATYVFPLARGSGQSLRLSLFVRPLDRNRRLLVALASGLAALLAGAALLIWAATRALVAPLRCLSTQVDAVAGGDPIQTRTTSPVLEVENVATAVAGMAAGLTQTAPQGARLEAGATPAGHLDRPRRAHPAVLTDATTGFELAADQHQVELRVNARAGTPRRHLPDTRGYGAEPASHASASTYAGLDPHAARHLLVALSRRAQDGGWVGADVIETAPARNSATRSAGCLPAPW